MTGSACGDSEEIMDSNGDMDSMFNLLTEPIIRIEMAGATRTASLPEVYAALTLDEIDAFPALRPHQRHAWHAFLVQLGVMAMRREGAVEPWTDAEKWVRAIRGLTSEYPDDEPWRLVVGDITRPAFMQPPAASSEREKDFKNRVKTPDQLDMLVTAKNHDLKSAVSTQSAPDDWIFALITLQTMQGFSGAGNFGISRMNGGFGSRPAFSLAPSGKVGAHARRDILALLDHRPRLLEEYPMIEGGIGLLWTEPWDGAASERILPDRLDPLYIEVCRRVRLRSDSGRGMYAVRASSKSARIESKSLNGMMGDPWTPIDRKSNKSLTLGSGGFNYKRISEYLTPSGNWELPALLRPTSSEESSEATMKLVARGMVRGQGKTEGYHERAIPIRRKTRMAMARGGGGRELGEIAQTRIEQIGVVQRILSHAIQTFMARGDSDRISPEQRGLARPWLNRLDKIIDARFFEHLQEEFEVDENDREGIRLRWLMNGSDGVVDRARDLLREAEDTLPCPQIHRYRARVNADSLFEGRLRGNSGLPSLFTERGADR